jgi:hypothetical protein
MNNTDDSTVITTADLIRAMAAAGCAEHEIDYELSLMGDALIEWANKVPGCADPVADGGWHEDFADEVWDNLHQFPRTR